MEIGPYRISGLFTLAPMAGITDAPFRRLCRRFGAAMTTSENKALNPAMQMTVNNNIVVLYLCILSPYTNE